MASTSEERTLQESLYNHISTLLKVYPLTRGLAALITQLNMMLISETRESYKTEDVVIAELSDQTLDEALFLYLDDAAAALQEADYDFFKDKKIKAKDPFIEETVFPLQNCTGIAFMSPGKEEPISIVASHDPSMTYDEALKIYDFVCTR